MVIGRYRWTVVERVESERIKLAAGAIGMMDKEVRMITEGGETVSQMGLGPAVGTFYFSVGGWRAGQSTPCQKLGERART